VHAQQARQISEERVEPALRQAVLGEVGRAHLLIAQGAELRLELGADYGGARGDAAATCGALCDRRCDSSRHLVAACAHIRLAHIANNHDGLLSEEVQARPVRSVCWRQRRL